VTSMQATISMILLLFIALAHAVPLTLLENTASNGAVCNDGTPGGYWVSKTNSSNWVIYLEGGALCISPATCYSRLNSSLTSSDFFPEDLPDEDFVPRTGPYASWNRVYIPYCSSDLFSGQNNGSTNAAVLNFTFNGHLIFSAIIADLKENHNLGDASEVLFWGDSAGALGVIYNINYLGSQLPNVTVKGVPNSGFFLNLATWQNSVPTITQLGPTFLSLWKPYIDSDCLSALNETYCIDAVSLYPYIKHDLFVIQSYIDQYETVVQLGVPVAALGNATALQFIIDVAASYRQYLAVLQTKPRDGWYLVTCFTHVENIYASILNNTTPLQAVQNWDMGNTTRLSDYCNATSAVVLTATTPGITCTQVANQCAKTQYALDPLTTASSSISSSISFTASSTASSTQSQESAATFAAPWIIASILCILAIL